MIFSRWRGNGLAGAGLAAIILGWIVPNEPPGGLVWVVFIGFFAGAVVGIPQRRVLREFDPELSRAWVPISSLAWGVFFPGAIAGLVLARRLGPNGRAHR